MRSLQTFSKRSRTAFVAATLFYMGCEKKPSEPTKVDNSPVIVEVAMMSQCPFANPLVQHLVDRLDPLGNAVSLRVSYLGQEREGNLYSIRGDREIAADKLGICAQELGAEKATRIFLGCLASNYEQMPDQWTECAKSADFDSERLRNCAEGREGTTLLRESFRRNSAASISNSPTVRIDGELYTGSRHSYSIVQAICNRHRVLNPDEGRDCESLESPDRVDVTLIGDQRCQSEKCSVDGLRGTLARALPNARIEVKDVGEPKMKELLRDVHSLPIAIISSSLRADPEALNFLGQSLLESGDGQYLLGTSSTWDPFSEICDNGLDDDGDNKVDCVDPDCNHAFACLPERKESLTVFLSTTGQFERRVIEALRAFLGQSAHHPPRLEIVLVEPKPPLLSDSSHRDAVLEREQQKAALILCRQDQSKDVAQFLDFLDCVLSKGESYQECQPTELDDSVALRACVASEAGKRLVELSYLRSRKLPVTRTPHVLVNGRFEPSNYSPEKLGALFCERNPASAGCPRQKTIGPTSIVQSQNRK